MRIVAAVSLVLLGACQPLPARSDGAAHDGAVVVADTARGTLSVVGSEPLTTVVLAQSGPGGMLAIEGTAQASLARMAGLEVVVTGRRTERRSMTASPSGAIVFDADRFEVRAADRIAAHDGIVTLEGGKFYLLTPSHGRLAADHLPAALRGRVGARVFLVGPLDRAPVSYGVIP